MGVRSVVRADQTGHCVLFQGVASPANDNNFMELLSWVDALKPASASSVTAVIPYGDDVLALAACSRRWGRRT